MCSGWIVQAWISMRWEHFGGYNSKIFMPPFRKYSNAGIHPGHWIPGSPSTLVSFNHDADGALFPTQVWWCHRLSGKRMDHPHPCVQSDPKIGALRIKELFPWEKHDQPLAHDGFEGQWVPLRDPKSLVSGPHSWVGMVQITGEVGSVDQPILVCSTWERDQLLSSSSFPSYERGPFTDGHTKAQVIWGAHLPQNPGPSSSLGSLLP